MTTILIIGDIRVIRGQSFPQVSGFIPHPFLSLVHPVKNVHSAKRLMCLLRLTASLAMRHNL